MGLLTVLKIANEWHWWHYRHKGQSRAPWYLCIKLVKRPCYETFQLSLYAVCVPLKVPLNDKAPGPLITSANVSSCDRIRSLGSGSKVCTWHTHVYVCPALSLGSQAQDLPNSDCQLGEKAPMLCLSRLSSQAAIKHLSHGMNPPVQACRGTSRDDMKVREAQQNPRAQIQHKVPILEMKKKDNAE